MKHSTSKILLNYLQVLLTVAVVLSCSACGSSQKESGSGPSTYDSVYDGYKKGDGKKKPERKPERQYSDVENKTKEPVVENTKDPVTPEVRKSEDPVVKKPEVKPERAEPVTLKEIKARYIEESKAAFDASEDYANAEGKARDEDYIAWAEHMYTALAYVTRYAAKGGSLEGLPELRKLKMLKGGSFKYALGPSDDPRVKAAIKKWTDSAK